MPESPDNTAPIRTKKATADAYFIEHRAKVLDIAAFLDRVDRAGGEDDYRVAALRVAISLLLDGKPERARRILELWSDQTTVPIGKAHMKGAVGCVDLSSSTDRST